MLLVWSTTITGKEDSEWGINGQLQIKKWIWNTTVRLQFRIYKVWLNNNTNAVIRCYLIQGHWNFLRLFMLPLWSKHIMWFDWRKQCHYLMALSCTCWGASDPEFRLSCLWSYAFMLPSICDSHGFDSNTVICHILYCFKIICLQIRSRLHVFLQIAQP